MFLHAWRRRRKTAEPEEMLKPEDESKGSEQNENLAPQISCTGLKDIEKVVINGPVNVIAADTEATINVKDLSEQSGQISPRNGSRAEKQSHEDSSSIWCDIWMKNENADIRSMFSKKEEGLQQAKEWLESNYTRITGGFPLEVGTELGGELSFEVTCKNPPNMTVSPKKQNIPLTRISAKKYTKLDFGLENSCGHSHDDDQCKILYEVRSLNNVGKQIDIRSGKLNFKWPLEPEKKGSEVSSSERQSGSDSGIGSTESSTTDPQDDFVRNFSTHHVARSTIGGLQVMEYKKREMTSGDLVNVNIRKKMTDSLADRGEEISKQTGKGVESGSKVSSTEQQSGKSDSGKVSTQKSIVSEGDEAM